MLEAVLDVVTDMLVAVTDDSVTVVLVVVAVTVIELSDATVAVVDGFAALALVAVV